MDTILFTLPVGFRCRLVTTAVDALLSLALTCHIGFAMFVTLGIFAWV